MSALSWNVGETNPRAALDEAKVREIRRRHAAGESYGRIAIELGVSRSAVAAVVQGRAWSHVR